MIWYRFGAGAPGSPHDGEACPVTPAMERGQGQLTIDIHRRRVYRTEMESEGINESLWRSPMRLIFGLSYSTPQSS